TLRAPSTQRSMICALRCSMIAEIDNIPFFKVALQTRDESPRRLDSTRRAALDLRREPHGRRQSFEVEGRLGGRLNGARRRHQIPVVAEWALELPVPIAARRDRCCIDGNNGGTLPRRAANLLRNERVHGVTSSERQARRK